MTSPLIQKLLTCSGALPNKSAIVDGSRSITFGEFETLVRRWAARLESRGVGRGDSVLVYVPPSIQLYAILLAIWWRGGVAVFADAWTTRHRLAEVGARIEPTLFIGVPRSLVLLGRIPAIRAIPREILWPLRRLPSAVDASTPVDVDPGDSALVTFTTGSSGMPKGADRTHRMLIAQHEALGDALGPIPEGPDLVTLPMFALHALAQGRTCLLAPINHARPAEYSPRRMIRLIQRRRPACMAASPAVYQTLIDHCIRHRIKLERPIHLHVGGAAVMPRLMWRLRRVFPSAVTKAVYGATEAEPIAIMDGDGLARLKGDLPVGQGLPAGFPWRGTDVRIIPARRPHFLRFTPQEWEDIQLSPGEVGEICVAGDHVLTGYHRQAGTHPAKIIVGDRIWHRTGDAGCIHEDGSLELHGPIAQSFDWRGSRWYPFPIEVQLDALPHVRKSTIVMSSSGPTVCLETDGRGSRRRFERALGELGLPDWPIWLGRIPRDSRHQSKIDLARLTDLIEAPV